MKKLLLKRVFGSVLLYGMFLIPLQGQTQELKSTHKDFPKNGRAIYKQAKIYDSKTGPTDAKMKRIADRALDRMAYERELTQNPFTKEIPADIKLLEAKFSGKILERSLEPEASKSASGMSARSRFSYWKNRGPGNVGGRTRALALDRRNENIVFAGGVSGGLWRSTNLGQSWKKVTRLSQSPSITAITQDPRERKSNVWYYASGERYGNSASGGGAFYTGTGIYKSVNRGRSWFPLRDSNDNDLTSITSLDIINSIAIDPDTGDLYAATFDGLFRSKKAKGEFEQILPSAFDSQTEVMITPHGKIYATVDIFGAENAGFYVLNENDEFVNITPADIIPAYGRTIMAYDPSDENRVYFFSYNVADFSEAFLWRYQADAETQEEQWVDLSANLPESIGGPVGDLNLQGAYNMVVKVHPENPDIVFIGGTNLYRSTDGFTTPVGAEGWIGGYDTANDITLYPNQHPDQHNMVFLPSDPNRVISSHDGGLSLSEDITNTDRVEWTSLNNKYITTQPYAISFDPEGNSDDLLAGFQDNSTWYTNSKSIDEPWVDQFSGDGSYNAIADGGLTRYVSAQGGVVFRLNLDENGEFVSFARVQPATSGFSFINPFILDPVNDNIMYMPVGDRMWRNSNLDEIPLFSNALATVNWSELTQTVTPDESGITALDVSKFPVANRLYYGTSSGMIFKMENSNIDDQGVVDISTGKGLPPGYVSNIYVDPTNPNRVFAVFSNYGIPSLFMTRDAGETWKDISGNLEENRDGSGNGPSVRWFAMNGDNDGYFVGTSTGLYFTYKLQGKRTRWYREPLRIGNGVVMQVKTRSDGFVAAGVHGNGVYSANFYVRERPEPNLSVAYLLADKTVAINSDPFEVDVTDLFTNEKKKRDISIELTNSNPELISAELDGNTLRVSIIAADTEGSAAIGLIATSGKEQVSEGFTVNVIEPAIYDQSGPVTFSSPSQSFTDFGGLTVQSADDFTIPEGSTWNIDRVIANGVDENAPLITDATVVIYADNNGLPGEEVYNSGSVVPLSDPDDYNLNLELPEVVELNGGTYWLSVYANLAFTENQFTWAWSTQTNVVGNEAALRDPGIFFLGFEDWTPQSIVYQFTPEDQVFQIFGMSSETLDEEVITETSRVLDAPLESENLAEIEADVITTVWPNPSSSEFFFSLKDNLDERVTTRVYNIIGQLVYEKADVDATRTFSWDASSNPAGLYMVKISGANTNKSFSIVKR